MRYNINKKKNKFNLTSLVILFYMFLNFFMNNLYKYKHYILVLITIIWFFWYIKYCSKIKEGIFGKIRNFFDPEAALRKLREEEKNAHNKAVLWACKRKAWKKHRNYYDRIKEYYTCYFSHDVKRVGTKIREA